MDHNHRDSARAGGAGERADSFAITKTADGRAAGSHGFHRQMNLSFLLLGAFQLLLIGVSVLGWWQFQQSYLQSMKTQEMWHERRQKITELETFAGLTTMPSMEDFHSGDWMDDRESMNRAASEFMSKADAFAQELAHSHDAPGQALLPTVQALRGQMQSTLEEADKAFAAFQAHKESQFEAETSYTDRIYRRVLISVGDLRKNAYDAEANDLQQQALEAGRVRNGSFLLVVGLSLLALVLVAYGWSLHRRLRTEEARLTAQRAALEIRVEESTAELQEGVMKLLHAQEAMQKIKAHMEEAQRLAHFGDWSWQVRTGEMTWSDETYRLLGFAPQSLPATLDGLLQRIVPEERDQISSALHEAAAKQMPVRVECRVIAGDGGERFVLLQGMSENGLEQAEAVSGFLLELHPQVVA